MLTVETLAHDFGLPAFDLTAYDKKQIPTEIVDPSIVSNYQALPLKKRGQDLFIAFSDLNQAALQEIKFHTGLNIHAILVEENKLQKLIEYYVTHQNQKLRNQYDDADTPTHITIDSSPTHTNLHAEIDDAPVVKFVNTLLTEAIHKEASDIHFENYENYFRVRLRQDGVLHEISNPSPQLAKRIATRLKVLSQLDIAERRLPQDGRFRMALEKDRPIDVRISTCPTVSGEKIVLRILDSSNVNLNIDQLGFTEYQQNTFLDAIQKTQGMILVTGPTGSGKTVTLYTALRLLNTTEVNISTVEDPVEMHLSGMNQVNINPKIGLTFATALRAFLRQDPDIMMVGEIRDHETAEISIKAAQTGHLVLSTLHTNSACEALTRLTNMGIASYNLADSINLIIAQRLIRRLCDYCKKPAQWPNTILAEYAEICPEKNPLFTSTGCEQCLQGYKGRTGIYEILVINDALKQLIIQGKHSLDIFQHAKQEGMQTLRQSGLLKIAQGITSLQELQRVIKD